MMVGFYESTNENRNIELISCLKENENNQHISRVIVFNETEDRPLKSKKITYIDINKRMTYRDYFEYANANLKNETCILANSDIIITEDIGKLNKFRMENVFICLSRWNSTGEVREAGADSQDTWVFKSPVKEWLVEMADYNMGTQFCDSVLSFLAYNSGYMLFNPSEEIVTKHIHSSEFRTEETQSMNALGVINGKYAFVHPSPIEGEVRVEAFQELSYYTKERLVRGYEEKEKEKNELGKAT
tara:strand:- start:241 stop:972 length:732 start_codon:yes stop_codon:yes gene_type:complete